MNYWVITIESRQASEIPSWVDFLKDCFTAAALTDEPLSQASINAPEGKLECRLLSQPFDEQLRRSGQTTKLIDEAVQELFKNGKTTFNDHYTSGDVQRNGFRKLLERLHHEHHLCIGSGIIVDYAHHTVKLIK